MATITVPQPIVMEFELNKSKNYITTRHFNLINDNELFSKKINISVNRSFSKALYTYYLKIWQGENWSKQLTGLFPTDDPDVFYRDTENKSHLLFVQFVKNGKILRLYHFKDFYTRRIREFLKVFKENY